MHAFFNYHLFSVVAAMKKNEMSDEEIEVFKKQAPAGVKYIAAHLKDFQV